MYTNKTGLTFRLKKGLAWPLQGMRHKSIHWIKFYLPSKMPSKWISKGILAKTYGSMLQASRNSIWIRTGTCSNLQTGENTVTKNQDNSQQLGCKTPPQQQQRRREYYFLPCAIWLFKQADPMALRPDMVTTGYLYHTNRHVPDIFCKVCAIQMFPITFVPDTTFVVWCNKIK